MTERLTHTHTQTICIKSLKIECSNIVIEQDVFECWVNFVGLSGSEIWYFISPSWLVGRIDQIHTIKTSKTLWWTILLYSQSPSGDSSRSLSLLMVTFWGTVFNLSVSHGVFCFVLFCFFNPVQFWSLYSFLIWFNIGACILSYQGFPDSSVGNESACNVGDPS